MTKNLFYSQLITDFDPKFAYNGMKLDDEISGAGNSYTAEFWQYDSRLGRRWNQDPVVKHWMSSYHSFSDNPIINIDPKGNTDYYSLKGKKIGSDGEENGLIGVVHDKKIARQIRRTGDLSKITNIENGAKFKGGFIIHKDILSKSVDVLKEAIVKGQDREISTTMDKSTGDKGYISTPIIIGEPNENGRETVPISKGEISIHSHPLGLKKIGRNDYKGSSTRPSDEIDGMVNDKEMFSQHKMNIIVGNSNEPQEIQGSPKIDQGELEINVFGNNINEKIGRIGYKEANRINKKVNQ